LDPEGRLPRIPSLMVGSHENKSEGDCDDLSNLTKIHRSFAIASTIDSDFFGKLLLGSWTLVWLGPTAAFVCKMWIDQVEGWLKPTILFILLIEQLLAALVSLGSKAHDKLTQGAAELHVLRDLLSWMHREVFSNDKAARITIMVPTAGRRELRVFLRPVGFPCTSETTLACECDAQKIEGAAGQCLCRNQAHTKVIDLDVVDGSPDFMAKAQEYANQSGLPLEKVVKLRRRAKYYFAVPLGGAYGNPLGVLVVDNTAPRILAGEKDTPCRSAEDRVRFLATLIADRLARVPAEILKRVG